LPESEFLCTWRIRLSEIKELADIFLFGFNILAFITSLVIKQLMAGNKITVQYRERN